MLAPLQSCSFLKNCWTSALGRGAVARQVGKSSGCSTHSLWDTPPSFNLADRFRNWVSPFTCNTTCSPGCSFSALHNQLKQHVSFFKLCSKSGRVGVACKALFQNLEVKPVLHCRVNVCAIPRAAQGMLDPCCQPCNRIPCSFFPPTSPSSPCPSSRGPGIDFRSQTSRVRLILQWKYISTFL